MLQRGLDCAFLNGMESASLARSHTSTRHGLSLERGAQPGVKAQCASVREEGVYWRLRELDTEGNVLSLLDDVGNIHGLHCSVVQVIGHNHLEARRLQNNICGGKTATAISNWH